MDAYTRLPNILKVISFLEIQKKMLIPVSSALDADGFLIDFRTAVHVTSSLISIFDDPLQRLLMTPIRFFYKIERLKKIVIKVIL